MTENQPPQNDHDEEKRKLRERTAEAFREAVENVREHGLAGLMPGGVFLSNCVKYGVIGLGALAVATVAHYTFDSVYYGDQYKQTLDDVAQSSAMTCGLDKEKRQKKLYAAIFDDVRGSTKNGVLNKIPVVGTWLPKMGWLPNGQAYDAMNALKQNHITLYPAGFFNDFDGGIQAVLYNDSAAGAVLAYKTLDDGQLNVIMDAIANHGALAEGEKLVLIWNDVKEEFETMIAAPEETTLTVGFQTAVTLPENPCLKGGLGSRALDGIKGWIPGMGSDEEDTPVPEKQEAPQTAPEQPETGNEAKEKGWFSGWKMPSFGWGKDDEAEKTPTQPETTPTTKTQTPAPS